MAMEIDQSDCLHSNEEKEDGEEEYVLLDLNDVSGLVDLSPGTPYVLSGLDTLNPILTIDEGLKLIGEYEETVGTCLAFSESEKAVAAPEEAGPSETNMFKGACIVDPSQAPIKEVKPIASLHKILRFRLLTEGEAKRYDFPTNATTEAWSEAVTQHSRGQPEADTVQPPEKPVEAPTKGQLEKGADEPEKPIEIPSASCSFDDRITVLGLSHEREDFRRRR